MAIKRRRRIELERILDSIGVNQREITPCRGGHLKVILSREGRQRFVITGSTPGDHRANLNFEREAHRIWDTLGDPNTTI